jgi:hypothetical protein
MENFSIDKTPNDETWSTVIFRLHAKFRIPLMVRLPKEKLEDIKTIVEKTLKEIDYEPSFLDSLEKLIGF